MRLVSKTIVSSLPCETIYQIMKSSAFRFCEGRYSTGEFFIYCPKRWVNSRVFLIPVKGNILENDNQVTVTLFVPAYFYFYLGCAIAAIGVLTLLLCFVFRWERWIPCIGLSGLGAFIIMQSYWEAIEVLSRLVKRVQNEDRE